MALAQTPSSTTTSSAMGWAAAMPLARKCHYDIDFENSYPMILSHFCKPNGNLGKISVTQRALAILSQSFSQLKAKLRVLEARILKSHRKHTHGAHRCVPITPSHPQPPSG
jgi:hypothetical protein